MMRSKILTGYSESSTLPRSALKKLNVALGEFSMHCRSKDSRRVSPSTIVGYLHGVNWFFKGKDNNVDMLRDTVFRAKAAGHCHLLDNLVPDKQEAGVHRQSFNVLSDNDIVNILDTADPVTPFNYCQCLPFVMGLPLGLLPESNRLLKPSNFFDVFDENGKRAIFYQEMSNALMGHRKPLHEAFL